MLYIYHFTFFTFLHRFRFPLPFKVLTWGLLNTFLITLVCWWWILAAFGSEKIFILSCVWNGSFLGIEFWINYVSVCILKCGASIFWLTLFHMPNLLWFLFIYLFFIMYLFFLLATFLSLPVLNEWIMMCLGVALIFLVLELIEFLCLWI